MRILGLACALAMAGAVICASTAKADIIAVNFPTDVTPGTAVSDQNAMADGFRISPSAEYSLVQSGGPGIISSGLGWDSDGAANTSYLGPLKVSTASLYVDHGGAAFTLTSAVFVSSGLDDNFEVMSSKGGVYDIPQMAGDLSVDFTGALWTNIDWLVFGYFDAGVPAAGLQQLVFSVEEPATLAVFGLGLLTLLVIRRRQVSRA